MLNLDDVVRTVVQDKMGQGELFTALDISNKVKESMPFARHRDVRDLVRGLFTTDIEPSGWARTPINVTLENGDQREAILYHPLSDSWDLDNKYDAQKRNQSSVKPSPATSVSTPTAVPVVTSVTAPASVVPVASPVVAPAPVVQA